MKRAVLLVDHGSRRAEANRTLDEVAELVRARRPDWIVQVAHMELASPGIAEGLAACLAKGAHEVVVHPYFLAPGRHSTRDIPRMVREAAASHPGLGALRVRVSEPLGSHPALVDAILDRVDAPEDP